MEIAQLFKEPGRDTQAVKQLFDSLFTPLCFCAERITSNPSESEDIAMTALEKLLQTGLATFENMDHVKRYAKKMVVNASLDYLRKQKAKKNYQDHLSHTEPINEEFITERTLYESEVIETIYKEVETLPRQTRDVFKKVYFEKKSTTEVAAELNISVNTVYVHCSFAIKKLRQIISERELMVFLLFAGGISVA